MSRKNQPDIIDVDGVQIFTADYIFEQMMAQSCRIDTCYTVAKISLLCSGIAILMSIVTLIATLLKAL